MSESIKSTTVTRFMLFYQAIVLARPKVTVVLLILLSFIATFFAQNYKVDASADALSLIHISEPTRPY